MMEWFFTTRAGMLALCGLGLVIFFLLAVVLEKRTKKLYPEHERVKFDEDSILSIFNRDDDEESEAAQAAAEKAAAKAADAEFAEAARLRAENARRAADAAKAKAAAAKAKADALAAKSGSEEIHDSIVSFRDSLDDWDPSKD